MKTLINAAFGRSRAVLLIFAMILIVGATAYVNIPKGSDGGSVDVDLGSGYA